MRVQLRNNGHVAVRAYDGLRICDPGLPQRSEAHCPRCHCRLSRYRPLGDQLCAPCQTSLHDEAQA